MLSLATADDLNAFYAHSGPPGDKLISTVAHASLPYTLLGLFPPSFTFTTETRLRLTGTLTRVDLPFLFPFFSNKYGSVLVHRNGLLSFDLPIGTSCTDSGTLGRYNGITPLWSNLITTGTAQTAEDVYLSSAPGSVTFRWQAETRAPFGGPGHPVNFAATLYDDGRIDFKYDPSNQNLNFDTTFFGCGLGPIAGISNGHEAFIQTIPFDTSGGINAMYRYDPPFGNGSLPTVKVESPAAGQMAQGVMNVSGIAYDTQSPITRIEVYIDGVAVSRTSQNTLRPDFCVGPNANTPGCPRVGYSVELNLDGLNVQAGSHTLNVRVTNSRGGFTDTAPVSFTVAAGQSRLPRAQIETPADGATVSGNVTVRGWALADDLRVTLVDILVDGVTAGPVSYGLARTDVCNAQTTKPPNCPNVGFTFSLVTRNGFPLLVDGPHVLKVRVRDETGRYTVLDNTAITINVKNGPDVPIVGVLTSPQNNDKVSGTVTLTGYAYSPGHRILAAFVILDSGIVIGSARVNQPAPDVCKNLTGVDACPNIGFTFSLDTTHLLNGLHQISLEIINDTGDFVIIPGVANGGVDVFVQN